MGRKAILFFTATCAFTLASCSKEEVVSEEWREGSGILEVSVTSVAETNASADEENIIRRLYIYAYDDSHAFPDYYCNTLVNNGNGANGTFQWRWLSTGWERNVSTWWQTLRAMWRRCSPPFVLKVH